MMIILQKQTDIGTDHGVTLWHFTGNAGNTWRAYSVDIGIVNYPFVVGAFFLFFLLMYLSVNEFFKGALGS